VGVLDSLGLAPGLNTGNKKWDSGVKKWAPEIQYCAEKHKLDANLVAAVMQQESAGINRRRSSAGAQGLMQLKPGTARALGVTNVNDPSQNICGGAKYLRQMIDQFGDTSLALAAYNAGPGNVQKAGNSIPSIPETQKYVRDIVARMNRYGGSLDQLKNTDPDYGDSIVTDAVEAGADTVSQVIGPVVDLISAIMNPATWLRVLKGFIGVILLIIALVFAWKAYS